MERFNFEGHAVRVELDNDGQPWWVLADVCGALGLTSPHKVADRIAEDEQRKVEIHDALGRLQPTNLINEPGLYRVIFRSNKPQAEAFQDWVFKTALPELRRRSPVLLRQLLDQLQQTRPKCDPWSHQVYLISDGISVKIGVSKEPEVRLRQLSTACPRRLTLLTSFQGGFDVEAEIHRHYESQRVNGEWFDLSGQDVLNIFCTWGCS